MAMPPTERHVRGKNFVFFGGSAGMGRAAALSLGRRGASVLIVGRSHTEGQATVDAVRSAGALSADFLAGDLATVVGIRQVAEGVRAWRPELHGVLHTAMTAFQGKQVTADGLEFAFALQYFARAALNRLLIEQLSASGDGRIVHLAGNAPALFRPDLDDLQFERRRWGFYKAVLGTHILGFLHIQEAALRWRDRPVLVTATCVGPTKTKAMLDPRMPLSMRLMGRFGTSPEVSAANAVRALTQTSTAGLNGTVLRSAKRFEPEQLHLAPQEAARLWTLTTELAAQRELSLP